MVEISRNFTREEFACPCCGVADISPILITRLQVLRDIMKRPLVVNSGFRCKKHNQAVGGQPFSQHMRGNAADISTEGFSLDERTKIYRLADALDFGGFGRYENFVHLDVRDGESARWVSLRNAL